MTETAERLKTELSHLSLKDREELASYLIQSLDEEEDSDIEAAWVAELAKRLEQINTGRVTGEPADKVFSDLRARHA